MDYEEFIEKCKRMGLNSIDYLVPKDKFKEIDDEAEYGIEEIEYLIDKAERTVRRWLSTGYLLPFKKGPYKCYGIEIKRTLFKEFHSQIMYRFEDGRKGS
ncbi:hypothetical protein AB1L12_04560 [Peribacillus frigoritolerans]|uniref:hypothetical protein n=1 Tax=Peribacillus frigoritolerans TaxID=450367 RepID=UPI0039A38576